MTLLRGPLLAGALFAGALFAGACQTTPVEPARPEAPQVHIEQPETAEPVERWRPLVASHFAADQVDTALCVIRHESHGDPSVINTAATEAVGGSIGLFQIAADNLAGRNRIAGLRRWEPPVDVLKLGYTPKVFTLAQARLVLLDPENNISAAAAIQAADGWLPAWLADREACGL